MHNLVFILVKATAFEASFKFGDAGRACYNFLKFRHRLVTDWNRKRLLWCNLPDELPMTINRIVAGSLSLLLLTLLGWSIFAGVGDLRTWIVLGIGAVLGLLYSIVGRLPNWIVDLSGGSITEDDDPSNLSPRVYLPILLGVIVVAVAVLLIVTRWL